MTSNINNRQMPIFISSTFQDMQNERDYLMKHSFPKLKEIAVRQSITLTPIDLRWGVTQEESKSGKVVELCLQEIDRCRPFFIGILGGRYGWCPQIDDFSGNTMLLDQYRWLQDDIRNGRSLTEIEMQYAVLRRHDHGHAIFFIKSSLKEHSEDKRVRRLADSIISKGTDLSELTDNHTEPNLEQRCFYSYYDTPEDLAMKVEKAFEKLFHVLFPMDGYQDEFSIEKKAQQAYLHELTDVYVPTVENERISYYLDRMTSKYEMIASDEKCYHGKSAFIANWIKERQKRSSCDIVYHFIGVGYLGGNYKRILKRLYLEVSALYGADVTEGDGATYDRDYSRLLSQLLQKTEIRKPLFIILDGLQHLSDYDGSKMLDWFPDLPDNVFMIVTAPSHDASYEVFRRRYDSAFFLYPFEEAEERLFIDRYLQKFGKRLSPTQSDRIISACASAGLSPLGGKNILTLKSLLNELVVFGSYELLDERIAYYCENHFGYFFPRMLERWEKDFGVEAVRLVLSLIVYSRAGLTETEILDITKATPSQWSGIYYSISHLLTLKGGKYYIDKDLVAKEIEKRYFSCEKDIRQTIIGYFRDSQDNRSVEECLFQYYKLQDYDSLYNIIIRLDVFSHLYESSGVAELLPYWNTLYTFDGGRRFRIAAYARQETPIEEKYARILADIAQFARQVLGDTESTRLLLMKSKEILDYVAHSDYRTLAQVYSGLGDYEMALENIDKALGCTGLSDIDSIETLSRLELMSEKGSVLFNMGQIKQAVGIWKQTLDKIIQAAGEISLPVSALCRNLAAAYQVLGADDLCKGFIDRMMTIIGKTVGEEHVYMGDALFLYGTYHEGTGHLVEALGFYCKALEVYQKWYPENHRQVSHTRDTIEKIKRSLPEDEFMCILDFYEGIVDDLYLVDEGREDGMLEYEYAFKYKHDCYIGKDRYVYGPSSNHIYIYVDSSGKYVSCNNHFDNLRDAQVNYMMNLSTFYKEYCTYKNIE